jgi:hypothetical protein
MMFFNLLKQVCSITNLQIHVLMVIVTMMAFCCPRHESEGKQSKDDRLQDAHTKL